MRVEQFLHCNQFVIYDKNYVYFQSYQSLIARYDLTNCELELYEDWDYSITTLKHLYKFIEMQDYQLWNRINNYKSKKLGIIKQIMNGTIIKCY